MKLIPKFMHGYTGMPQNVDYMEYIVHTQEPEFIAVILTADSPELYKDRKYPFVEHVAYLHTDGILQVYALAPLLLFGDTDEYLEKKLKKMDKTLKRMGNWYKSELKKEDAVEKGKIWDLSPYSDELPYTFVVTNSKGDRFIVVNYGSIKKFATEEEANQYLIELGIYKVDGVVNIITPNIAGLN